MAIQIDEEQLLDLLEETTEALRCFAPYFSDVIAKAEMVLKLAGRKLPEGNHEQ